MKKYTRPNIEIVTFEVEDIITSSGLIVNSGDFVGADADMYKVYEQNSAVDNTNVAVFTW